MRPYWALAIAVNAGAAIPWWIALHADPVFRRRFLPASHPDTALMSLEAADLILFVTAGLAAAYGVWRSATWSRSVLLLHTGAACYASIFTLQQYFMTGEAGLAAAAMLPSLGLLPWLCWKTR